MNATALASMPRRLHEVLTTPLPAHLGHVTKTYGSTVALNGVTLSIQPGELLALLGANGAGKTTAVRLLLGLGAPTEGTVRVFGEDPRDAANRIRTVSKCGTDTLVCAPRAE